MNTLDYRNPDRVSRLEAALKHRILVVDGAMGTMIQARKLEEKDYRNKALESHPLSLKGNNDLLSLTQPDIILDIHREFLAAGAEILETNTFNATSIAQADYGTGELVYEINRESARIARLAAEEHMHRHPGQERFVADRFTVARRKPARVPQCHV